jgi:hypothetical protein
VSIEKDMAMTSDVITIWAGILGLAYLAVAGNLLGLAATVKRHPTGCHSPRPVRVKRAR